MSYKRRAISRSVLIASVIIIVLIIVGAFYTLSGQEKEKVVVIGVTDKITDLDPANAYDFFTWEVLSNVMAGLVKYDPDTGKIVGDLATSWDV
ncbi:MAG: peptide ABC transporter substrate-binding protein, partial [Desulfurococcales archaeon]|nr:peptide ABC transporter substrate-binding protein [Desulfurococcales archaeon]